MLRSVGAKSGATGSWVSFLILSILKNETGGNT